MNKQLPINEEQIALVPTPVRKSSKAVARSAVEPQIIARPQAYKPVQAAPKHKNLPQGINDEGGEDQESMPTSYDNFLNNYKSTENTAQGQPQESGFMASVKRFREVFLIGGILAFVLLK